MAKLTKIHQTLITESIALMKGEALAESLDLRLSAEEGEPVMYKGTKSILKQYTPPAQSANIDWNDEYITVKIKDLKPVKGYKYKNSFK